MTVLVMTSLVMLGGFVAGLVGALTGLGGGIVIVPLLTLAFHVDVHYAVGASLISVIATSSGAAAAYVREGFTNIRVGMFLEVASTSGALAGAYLALLVSPNLIAVLFGLVLLFTAVESLRPHPERVSDAPPRGLAARLRLGSSYPGPSGPRPYQVERPGAGFALMIVAGALSALLGIGGGVLKVLAMDRTMRLPFKVSTTTSNFMIGVTAAASAAVYLGRGYIVPALAMPVMLGVLAGALVGARLLRAAETRALRLLFTAVVVVLALEMLYRGIGGKF